MPNHDESDRHKPPTGATLFPAISSARNAGPLAYAIECGLPIQPLSGEAQAEEATR